MPAEIKSSSFFTTVADAVLRASVVSLDDQTVSDTDIRKFTEDGVEYIAIAGQVVPAKQVIEVGVDGRTTTHSMDGSELNFLFEMVRPLTPWDMQPARTEPEQKVTKIDAGTCENNVRQLWVAQTEKDLMDEFKLIQKRFPTPGYGTMMHTVRFQEHGPHQDKWTAIFFRGTSCD